MRKVTPFWDRARIPVQDESRSIPKVEKLFSEWQTLQKHASRGGPSFEENCANFQLKLQNLFDIAHGNAMEIIKIEEDKQFLISQREPGRRGYMGKIDKELCGKGGRSEKRKLLEQQRK